MFDKKDKISIVLFGTIILFLLIPILSIGCETKTKKQQIYEEQQQKINFATKIVDSIYYIKDPKTGLCFAYLWGGMSNGGPALTLVPEDKIPANLLIVAENK